MILTYEIENNLYVNVTNKCSNACQFCIRELKDAFQYNLWLEKEPTTEEIIDDIFSRNLSQYKQLVFCGFGEPLENIDCLPPDHIMDCQKIADESGVTLKVRHEFK